MIRDWLTGAALMLACCELPILLVMLAAASIAAQRKPTVTANPTTASGESETGDVDVGCEDGLRKFMRGE